MKTNRTFAGLTAAMVLAGSLASLSPVAAQRSLRDESHRRQQSKNTWRNVSIGAGALGLYGLLKHDNTLTFAGAAGSLYSLNRYEQDRKSQSRTDHTRAAMFSRSSFDRNGQHYVRRTVTRNGHRYYQFVRR